MKKEELIKKYYNQKSKLTIKNKNYLKQLKSIADFILFQDLGNKGDITSDKLIRKNKTATAFVIAKQSGILGGVEEAKWLAENYKIKTKTYKKDGNKIKPGQKIMNITGNIKEILKMERLLINIIQRMSGIATETNKLIKKTNNKVLLTSTRKTPWGLLDKKAVVMGGGGTHRLGLYDWMLIKDNHLNFAKKYNLKKLKTFWEMEVINEKELKMAIRNHAPAIMFDNFESQTIKKLIKKHKNELKNIVLEASGMINEKNINKYASSGVDIISIGKITHSAKTLDISLKII